MGILDGIFPTHVFLEVFFLLGCILVYPPPRLWVSIRDGKVSVFFSCTPSVDKNDVS